MEYITYDRALRLVDSSIDTLNSKLNGHCEQVSYVLYKLLLQQNERDEKFLLKMCITAYLHDIGCYKTEDMAKITEFEFVNSHAHAIYGYLFLKNFFNDEIDLQAIKYHHLNWSDYHKIDSNISKYANLLFLADRIAISSYDKEKCLEKIKSAKNTLFNPEYVDIFLETEKQHNILNHLQTGLYKAEIRSFLSKFFVNKDKIEYFAQLMCYAIDFHSYTTVDHSILVSCISKKLATKFNYNDEEIKKICVAASLHDIGKLVIPTEILEKPEKLTAEEYEVMKYHAIAGYDILSNLGIAEIRDIGSLHHEKLDGSGYPFGLKENEISFNLRLVTVADIAAALIAKRSYKDPMSKDKVIALLREMACEGKIDKYITEIFFQNYDDIMEQVQENIGIHNKFISQIDELYEKEHSDLCTKINK